VRLFPAAVAAAAAFSTLAHVRPAHADVTTQDADERAQLKRDLPAAAEALALGDAAATAGKLEEATAHFASASNLAPRNPLPARRYCEVLAARGLKHEAIAACERAKTVGGSPLEMRAIITAYLSGDKLPTSDELAHAWFYAGQIHRHVPTLGLPYAARCEIALRIGDGRLLHECLEDLARLAPDDAETRRIQAAVAAATPWRMWLGFAAIAAALLFTAAHAARKHGRWKLRPAQPLTSGAAILLALLTGAGIARADQMKMDPKITAEHYKAAMEAARKAQAAAAVQSGKGAAGQAPEPGHLEKGDLTKGIIDENDPEGSVPDPTNMNPLEAGYVLQDLLARAEDATKRNDWPAVVKWYRAIVKMVPDRSAGFVKLCEGYEKIGDAERARKACALALSADGVTVDDYAKFVRLVLAKTGPLDQADRAQIDEVVKHLLQDPKTLLPAYHLQCELAVRVSDQALLETCSRELYTRAPNDAKSVGFRWALAMQKQQYDEARSLIEKAKQAGVRPDGIANMEALTGSHLGNQRVRTASFAAVALLLIGLGVAGYVTWSRTRRPASPA
jgi:tetratricopeptide (TPR) repeat protein